MTVSEAKMTLEPWRALEVLAATDRHVAEWVARLFGGAEPDVALAFALAVRAPRYGHLAVDLGPETVEAVYNGSVVISQEVDGTDTLQVDVTEDTRLLLWL